MRKEFPAQFFPGYSKLKRNRTASKYKLPFQNYQKNKPRTVNQHNYPVKGSGFKKMADLRRKKSYAYKSHNNFDALEKIKSMMSQKDNAYQSIMSSPFKNPWKQSKSPSVDIPVHASVGSHPLSNESRRR